MTKADEQVCRFFVSEQPSNQWVAELLGLPYPPGRV